jgi:hypothetical protein
MRASRSRCSILIVAAVLVVTAACSSDTTTTADGSTTSVATSTPPTGPPDTAGPGTSETGVTQPDDTVDPSDPGGGGPDTTEGSTTTTGGGGAPDPSVPIVDAASVEAFCALTTQLEDLADNQLDVGDVSDPEVLRTKMAAFLTDNAAVIDQYLASAPPEIEDDVEATMDQTRAAVNDPELFAELMGGNADTASSERVSDFVDANCPDT